MPINRTALNHTALAAILRELDALDGRIGRLQPDVASVAARWRIGRARAYLRTAVVELRDALACGVDPVVDQPLARPDLATYRASAL